MDTSRIRARDAALQRLRRTTRLLAAAAGVLGLVAGGMAAKAFPGRSAGTTGHAGSTRPAPASTTKATQSAPPLVSVGSPAQPSPSPSASAPTPSPAPPAVVSGGS